jgi:hypothetical protein
MAGKKPQQLEWEELKAIIDNFTPEEHAKFTEQIRGYFREYGLEVRQKLEALVQSDNRDVAEAAQALIAYYWKSKPERR